VRIIPGTEDELVEALCEVGRYVVAHGLVVASGGNLSARLPGADTFVITAAGTWLDQLVPADFSVLNLAGEVVRGAAAPSTEWKLHRRTYEVRPDINAVIHLHPQHAVLVDALGHQIRLITLDHATYVRSVGTVPYLPTGSDELAEHAARAALEHDCVVLSHHGSSTLGGTIEMAVRRALNLEEAAVATYRCLLLGETDCAFPAPVPPLHR
jgi:L-fuculose-phosphate aldolase